MSPAVTRTELHYVQDQFDSPNEDGDETELNVIDEDYDSDQVTYVHVIHHKQTENLIRGQKTTTPKSSGRQSLEQNLKRFDSKVNQKSKRNKTVSNTSRDEQTNSDDVKPPLYCTKFFCYNCG